MSLSPGTRIRDNLELQSVIGHGGMGTVWRARNLTLQADVAVKVLSTGRGNEEATARFAREARGLAQVSSPHVVRVFDFGTTPDGDPYIVMELLEGEELLQRINRKRLSLRETCDIVRQTCLALAAAHERGIVHRDIKPANIFLSPGGEGPFVRVLDFGVAQFRGPTTMGMTQTGTLVGTPYYMSPEQLLGARDVDARADLWSLAVVAYGCLAGTLPFLGETIGALSVAIHKGRFEPLRSHRSDLPLAVDEWMARALHPNIDRRFASAREMSAALDDASPDASLGSSRAPVVIAQGTSVSPLAQTLLTTRRQLARKPLAMGVSMLILAALSYASFAAAPTSLTVDPPGLPPIAFALPSVVPSLPAAQPEPTRPTPSGHIPTGVASPSDHGLAPGARKPHVSPPPKRQPTRSWHDLGSGCLALPNNRCPSASSCCAGSNDIVRKQGRRCACFRPICRPGEGPRTHGCVAR